MADEVLTSLATHGHTWIDDASHATVVDEGGIINPRAPLHLLGVYHAVERDGLHHIEKQREIQTNQLE